MKKRKFRFQFAFLSILSFTLLSATQAATIEKGEIRFKPGSTSGTVSGAVMRGDRDHYSLMAGAGQWMKVDISALEDNAVFQISIYSYGTGEDIFLDGAKEGEDAKHWYGQLPKPGYSKDGEQNAIDIVVGGTRGNATYDLSVSIQDKAITPAAKGNSANGKYRTLLQTINCPRDKAKYGKFTDYGYWKGGAWCKQTGQAGYWVWEYPNWYVWAEKAGIPGKAMGGTVTSLQAGDTGCYVEFNAADGAQHNEIADFDICEQSSFIGKKVRFSYTKQNVMSAECGGDPECTLSDSVWVIDKMSAQ